MALRLRLHTAASALANALLAARGRTWPSLGLTPRWATSGGIHWLLETLEHDRRRHADTRR